MNLVRVLKVQIVTNGQILLNAETSSTKSYVVYIRKGKLGSSHSMVEVVRLFPKFLF